MIRVIHAQSYAWLSAATTSQTDELTLRFCMHILKPPYLQLISVGEVGQTVFAAQLLTANVQGVSSKHY